MGAEAIVAAVAGLLGIFTWSHQQRQAVLNDRFNSVKRRLDEVEKTVSEFPAVYVSKTDLNFALSEIKDRLNHINDKLDQLMMSRINEKF